MFYLKILNLRAKEQPRGISCRFSASARTKDNGFTHQILRAKE